MSFIIIIIIVVVVVIIIIIPKLLLAMAISGQGGLISDVLVAYKCTL